MRTARWLGVSQLRVKCVVWGLVDLVTALALVAVVRVWVIEPMWGRSWLTDAASLVLLAGLLLGPLWIFLGREVLRPLERILEADRKALQSDAEGRLIPESAIPDGELGALLRSRNGLLLHFEQLNQAGRDLVHALGQAANKREFLQSALEALTKLTEARYGAIGILDKDDRYLRFLNTGLSAAEVARIGDLPAGRGVLGVILEEGAVLRLEDVGRHPRAYGVPPHHPVMKSLLAAPIIAKGLKGRIYLCNKAKNQPFSEADEALVLAFTRSLQLALEEITLKEEIKAAEERYRVTMASLPVSVVRLGKDRTIRLANRAFYDLVHRRPEDSVGRPLSAVLPAVGIDEFLVTAQAVGKGPLERRVWEAECVMAGGERRVLRLTASGIRRADDDDDDDDVLTIEDVTERTRAEKALRGSEERFRLIVHHVNDALFYLDVAGVVLWTNHQAEVVTGWPMNDLVGRPLMAVLSSQSKARAEARLAAVRRGEPVPILVELEVIRPDGSLVWLEVSATTVKIGEDVVGRLLVARDLTERRQAEEVLRQSEEQLRQAQKMESVGQLAGGIAHDFNNLLMVIMGYSRLALDAMAADDPQRSNLDQIKEAGQRAATLTQQLLAFSRKQVLQPKVLDLNAVVANMDKMLARLISENIALVTALKPGLGCVKADVGQLEQVIINLVINACDAMPQGGKLTIETANVELDDAFARTHIGNQPGPYVMLAVSDTGCGMDAAIQARIFEPFFTTKEKGKGTGLGLSMVHGIIKQSGGGIWVYSEPGHGTTFKVYLPRTEEAPDATGPSTSPAGEPRGSETILLVEDDEGVRKITAKILKTHGYTVLEAGRGEEAFRVSGRHDGPIRLLVTDVVMPGMSGRELAERLRSSRPGMRVLFMSGYTDDVVVRHGVWEARMAFLQKPFTPGVLLHKVREVLDAPEKQG